MKISNLVHVLCTAILLAATTTTFAQPDSLWSRTFGGSGHDYCYSVQQTSDGGYILAGSTDFYGAGYDDFWLVKTDANGDTLWTRTYGGDGSDECSSVQQTSDGGYILAGYEQSWTAFPDGWLVRADANGDSLWSRNFNAWGYDYFKSVLQTPDGGFAVVGQTRGSGVGNNDFWLVRTDSSGTELWSRTYGGSANEFCNSLQQTSDGGYILAGSSKSFGAGNEDYWLVKTNADGDSLWSRTFGTIGQEFCESIAQTSDGGYILAGTGEGFGGLEDFWLIRTDANGDSLWSKVFGGIADDRGVSVHQTWDDGFILAGQTRSYGVRYNDFWLIRTDENGNTLWTTTYGGLEQDYCYTAALNSDGGYILAGRTNGFGAEGSDMWLVKTERDPLLAPPDSFNLVSPADEDTVWTVTPTVDWEDATDPDPGDIVSYVIYWSQDSLFAEADSVIGLTESEYTFSNDYPLLPLLPSRLDDLPDDVVIYWKVRGVDSYGLFRWCTQLDWNFHVYGMDPPSPFNLLTPENGALLELGATTFTWESAIDPDPGDVVTYTLYFESDEGSMLYVLGSDTTIDVAPDTVAVLLPGDDATWYVTAECMYPDTMIECSERFTFTASAADISVHLPREFRLYQNWPNPFNPRATIRFDIARVGKVNLRVFDVLGKEVATLVDDIRSAGSHSVTFDGSEFPSGIYFYSLQAGDFITTKKMVLLK